MKLDIQIQPPIRDLVKELEAFAEGLGEKGIRAGLVRGAKPIKDAMKSRVPVREGALQKGIGHNSLSKRAKARLGVPQNTAAILVGANRKVQVNTKSGTRKVWQGKKAHWMEEGTDRMRARPFMEQSMSAAGAQFESRFYQGLSNYLERQRAKHSR